MIDKYKILRSIWISNLPCPMLFDECTIVAKEQGGLTSLYIKMYNHANLGRLVGEKSFSSFTTTIYAIQSNFFFGYMQAITPLQCEYSPKGQKAKSPTGPVGKPCLNARSSLQCARRQMMQSNQTHCLSSGRYSEQTPQQKHKGNSKCHREADGPPTGSSCLRSSQ